MRLQVLVRHGADGCEIVLLGQVVVAGADEVVRAVLWPNSPPRGYARCKRSGAVPKSANLNDSMPRRSSSNFQLLDLFIEHILKQTLIDIAVPATVTNYPPNDSPQYPESRTGWRRATGRCTQ